MLEPLRPVFPGATASVRPTTPVPDEPRLGDWTWRLPLPPKRRRHRPRRLVFWSEDRPTFGLRSADPDEPDRYGDDWDLNWFDLGPNLNGCIRCGRHCDPRDLAGCSRLLDGRWEHLECWLKSGGSP